MAKLFDMYKNIVNSRAEYLQLFKGKLDSKEMFLLEFAYDLAKYAHGYLDQVRDGGERYFNHPREVSAIIATELNIYDLVVHVASLIHDGDEDTFLLKIERIRHIFGDQIADTVKAVSKKNLTNMDKDEYLDQYFHGIVCAGWRACVVKCGDRIHNLRTLLLDDREKVSKQIYETELFFPKLCNVIRIHNPKLSNKVSDSLFNEIGTLKFGANV